MKAYHKIPTMFKRNPETNFKTLIVNDYATEELLYLAENRWVFTEKIDGTNIRVIYKDGKVEFRGKTDNSQIPSKLYKVLSEKFTSDKMAKVFDGDVCLYGEGYGNGIQKGGCYIPDGMDFILFDVRVDKWWLMFSVVQGIAQKLGIKSVPIRGGGGTLRDAFFQTQIGFRSTLGEGMAEGIVMRPAVDLFDRAGNRIIAKIKHKDFK